LEDYQEYRDKAQEFLYRKSAEGDRARIVLDELEQYFKEAETRTLAALFDCNTESEAYWVAVGYQAVHALKKKLESVVTQGKSATKNLMKE
jgi:hypothetical protein